MKTRKLVNPEYVSELEHKIFKIETILDIVESKWEVIIEKGNECHYG